MKQDQIDHSDRNQEIVGNRTAVESIKQVDLAVGTRQYWVGKK
jgi:hypothetical protein